MDLPKLELKRRNKEASQARPTGAFPFEPNRNAVAGVCDGHKITLKRRRVPVARPRDEPRRKKG